MKKMLTLTMISLMLVVLGVATAEAATSAPISVTVTITASDLSVAVDPTAWAADPLAEGGSDDTGIAGFFTVTNDSTNRMETFSIIAGASSPSGWTAAAAAADEVYVMEALGGDLAVLTSIHTSQTLETGVAPAGAVDLDLKITAPTATDFGGVEQTITVTVTAS